MEQNYYRFQQPEQINYQNTMYYTPDYQSSYSNYNTVNNENYKFLNQSTNNSPFSNHYRLCSTPGNSQINYNYNSIYQNESYNYSFNDSAYQTQTDYSQYNYSTSYQSCLEVQPTEISVRKRKREQDELSFNGNDSQNQTESNFSTETNKRPKILKLEKFESENSFKCHECGMCFSSKAKYLLHQFKAHNNGVSCVCPVCYKRFGNQANTLVHLRGHTQEKSYKCNQCTNAFYDSSTLKKHLRTHTGEKPYECHLCPKKFTQSGNLKRHLLVHKKYDEDVYDNQESQDELYANKENINFDWTQYQNNLEPSQNFNSQQKYEFNDSISYF